MKLYTLVNNGQKLVHVSKKNNSFIFNNKSKRIYAVKSFIVITNLFTLAKENFPDVKIVTSEDEPTLFEINEKKESLNKKIKNNIKEDDEDNLDEDYLFNELNEKCLLCIKDCKQSSKAKILQCKQFTKIK